MSDEQQAPTPAAAQPPAKLSYISTPALVTALVLSLALLAGSLAVWWALGPGIRAQVTWLQAATLLFFVIFMLAMLLAIGYSHLWAADGEVVIRNGPVMRRFRIEDIAGLRLRKGDPWAYLLIKDPTFDDGIRRRAVMAIQAVEGKGGERKVRELRTWLKVNGASSEGIVRPD